MGTNGEFHYSVYVILLDERIGTLPQMRLRNPNRDLSKPWVYVGLTPLRVGPRFDFRRATVKAEWRVQQFGIRLMPELYERMNPITYETALQTAKKLAEDLRAKGFGVVNGISAGTQSYRFVRPQQNRCSQQRNRLRQILQPLT